MKRLRAAGIGIVLAAMLGSVATGPAIAQSSATKKAPAGAGKPAAAAPGTPASDTSVAGSFGNWTLLCGKEGQDKKAKERCSLVLPLVEKESKKLVFRVILTYGPKGNLVLRVDGPTGIALQRGLEFSSDTQKLYRMPYQTCLPMGCKALLIVEDELRRELTKSKQGSITVYALNGKTVRTVAALDGFSAGMQALDAQAKGTSKSKAKKK